MVGALKIENITENQPNRIQANYEIGVPLSYDSVLSLVRTHKLFRFYMLLNVV